jgi:outer membrane protein OmpA-like peptidoglycan-associated protein
LAIAARRSRQGDRRGRARHKDSHESEEAKAMPIARSTTRGGLRAAGAAALLGLLAACAQPVSETRFPAPSLAGGQPAAGPPATPPVPAPGADVPSDRAFVVFFEAWSAAIQEPAMEGLTRVAQIAREHPRQNVLVIGYTDPRGSGEANRLLSRLRAQIVRDTLVEKGVAPQRIRIVSRGPTAGLESVESRRVEVRAEEPRPARRAR